MEWMILPLKRYFDFRGRSRRKEFWMWVLFVFIVAIVLSILDGVLGLGGGATVSNDAATDGMSYSYGAATRSGWLTNIFTLAVLIPNLAVSVRRLHDINRTGWWIIVPIILYAIGAALLISALMSGTTGSPGLAMIAMLLGFVSAIVLLVFYCMEGTSGPNRFGPDPKDPNGAIDVEQVFR